MEIIRFRKGQVFTLIAIVLLGLVFLSYSVYTLVDDRGPIKTRISTMENFLFSIEENLERQLFIAGFRIIFLAEDHIATTGTYISDVDALFNETFYNGTYQGVVQSIMVGATYDDILSSIETKSNKINVETTLSNPRLDVRQIDPWNVQLTLTVDFVMKDSTGLAQWEKVQNITALVPIAGFEDPFYLVEANGLVSKKINRTVYASTYVVGGNVSAGLLPHVQQGLFDESLNGPNFLMRLAGDLSSDPSGNGIESFVNTNALAQQGLPVSEKTTIDYLYFSGSSPAYEQVSGMPSWFYIDDTGGHYSQYNVTGLTFAP